MEYLGEILDQHAFDLRYPTDGRCSESEHAVGILCTDGSHAFVDAVRPERSTLARYMNHAGDTPNCVLWTLNEPDLRWLLFAKREIAEGEELVWHYGESFWNGREGLRL